MLTNRIPGFAICARCGTRSSLGPCARCGMLLCKDCRGDSECVLCYRDTLSALVGAERRRRWRQFGQRLGVAACLAATALAGAGAALLPDLPPTPSEPHQLVVARGEVRFVGDAVERWFAANGASCPPSLAELRAEGYLLAAPIDPWGEPLLYGCSESPRSIVVMSKGPDRQAGSIDDVIYSVP